MEEIFDRNERGCASMNLVAILLWIGIIICCVGEVMITIKMIKGGSKKK